MPSPVVKKFASKAGIPVSEAETKWKEAKAQAAKQGKSENYAYITSIFKNMIGECVADTKFMEATVSGAVPGAPNPLASIGPFTKEERAQITKRIKSIFPNASESAIDKVVFGNQVQEINS